MLHDFDRCVKAGFGEHAARFLDGEDHLGLLEGLTGLDAVAEAAEVYSWSDMVLDFMAEVRFRFLEHGRYSCRLRS